MTTVEIALIAAPQTFTVTLGGTAYTFTIKWNGTLMCWVLDLADAQGNNIVTGIPMVPGTTLLGQYAYLGLGFDLFVQNDANITVVPGFTDLGTTSHLYALVAA